MVSGSSSTDPASKDTYPALLFRNEATRLRWCSLTKHALGCCRCGVANNGKVGLAPCGHLGRAVIGQYYQCLVCDVSDGTPKHIDDRITEVLCGTCGSDDLKVWPGFTVDGRDLWFCKDCKSSFFA